MYSVQLVQGMPTHSPRALPLVAVAAVHVIAIAALANGLRLVDRPSLPQGSTVVSIDERPVETFPPVDKPTVDPYALAVPKQQVSRPTLVIESELASGETAIRQPHTDLTIDRPTGEGPFIGVRLLKRIEPHYPEMSKRLDEQGVATILATIGINGRVTSVELKTSSGYARLDQAALKSVRDWQFEPARRGSQLLTQTVTVPVRFELHK